MQQLLFRRVLPQVSIAALAVTCSLLPVNTARAVYSWQNIQFGGFASQGYLESTANDYLGNTDSGTFDFREYGANASWSHGEWRLGAQVFGQKLGEYGDDKLKLDWATIDYQPAQAFGVRVGRVKMPRGLYNEALDLDSVRPYVLLPQGVYDARLRDFNAAFNGAMLFGNIELRKAGSLDYRLFYGRMPITTDSGASDYFNNDIPFAVTRIHLDAVRGGALYWNTPVNGLRLAYSYSGFEDLSSLRHGTIPYLGEYTVSKDTHLYERHLWSAEYVTGNWTFATEYGTEYARYDISVVGFGFAGQSAMDSRYYYVAASRRMNTWLELGAYYSNSHAQYPLYGVEFAPLPPSRQGDYAVSARFDINEHVIFKLEGHYMDGAGYVFDTPTHPQPQASRDNSWMMLAAKMSLTF